MGKSGVKKFLINKKNILLYLGLFFFFFLDRFFKYLSVNKIISNSFFVLSKNKGAFMGIFKGEVISWTFYFSVILIIIIIIYFIYNFKKIYIIEKIGWLLVLIGGFSNTFDRIYYGFVIDYINSFFSYLNLADIYITLGVVAILFWQFKKLKI